MFFVFSGSDIDAIDDERFTALLIAVSKGHEAVTEVLMNAKADITLEDENGKHILHWVAETESIPLATVNIFRVLLRTVYFASCQSEYCILKTRIFYHEMYNYAFSRSLPPLYFC